MGKPRPAKISIYMKNDKGHDSGYVEIVAMLDHSHVDRLVSETPTKIVLLHFGQVPERDRGLLPAEPVPDPPQDDRPDGGRSEQFTDK